MCVWYLQAVCAGRPQVVCPFAFDQSFWAQRVQWMGVGQACELAQELKQARGPSEELHEEREGWKRRKVGSDFTAAACAAEGSGTAYPNGLARAIRGCGAAQRYA